MSARARGQGTVVLDFRVEQEDSVYPMVAAGAELDAMIRRPEPSVLVETEPTQSKSTPNCQFPTASSSIWFGRGRWTLGVGRWALGIDMHHTLVALC